MANTTNYVSYTHSPSNPQDLESRFTVTFTGDYVSGTGETVNLNDAGNPDGLELNGSIPSGSLPEGIVDVLVAQFTGYNVQMSTYLAGEFNVRFFVQTTGDELASGAYPGAITNGQLNVAVRHRL